MNKIKQWSDVDLIFGNIQLLIQGKGNRPVVLWKRNRKIYKM